MDVPKMVTLGSSQRLYQKLIEADRSVADTQGQQRTARNGLAILLSSFFLTAGDQMVNAKTVLPWLMAALGGPGWITALLVPVRESGSMLPQAALARWVRRKRYRKPIWLIGMACQAGSAALMAVAAATLHGTAAGLAILLCLAGLAVSRSLVSIAHKDVVGRTIPKGERGQISGLSTAASGAAAILLGLTIRVFGGDALNPGILAGLLFGGAAVWLFALWSFSSIDEPAGERDTSPNEGKWFEEVWTLLRSDALFRRFVAARGLLLVSALSPPFVVTLASREIDTLSFSTLGPFLLAQGLANLMGGRVFGRLADKSSRMLMMGTAAAASMIVVVFLVARVFDDARHFWLLYPVTFFALALTHVGVRVARSTYVVDMAEGNTRTSYVAVSNTAMGLLLLLVGAVTSALGFFGESFALIVLAALGFVGVLAASSLPEVER